MDHQVIHIKTKEQLDTYIINHDINDPIIGGALIHGLRRGLLQHLPVVDNCCYYFPYLKYLHAKVDNFVTHWKRFMHRCATLNNIPLIEGLLSVRYRSTSNSTTRADTLYFLAHARSREEFADMQEVFDAKGIGINNIALYVRPNIMQWALDEGCLIDPLHMFLVLATNRKMHVWHYDFLVTKMSTIFRITSIEVQLSCFEDINETPYALHWFKEHGYTFTPDDQLYAIYHNHLALEWLCDNWFYYDHGLTLSKAADCPRLQEFLRRFERYN